MKALLESAASLRRSLGRQAAKETYLAGIAIDVDELISLTGQVILEPGTAIYCFLYDGVSSAVVASHAQARQFALTQSLVALREARACTNKSLPCQHSPNGQPRGASIATVAGLCSPMNSTISSSDFSIPSAMSCNSSSGTTAAVLLWADEVRSSPRYEATPSS